MQYRRDVDVAIVGSGIQGCGIALELADRGVRVELFERRARLCDGATRHSEGKVHLGYVYSADTSLRTARLMADGAAVFAGAMERWLGPAAGELTLSAPFHYAVHRDSMRTSSELEAMYARVAAYVRRVIPERAYFGIADPAHLRRLDPEEAMAFGPDAVAVFETAEVAVEPNGLADALAAAVEGHDGIATWADTQVLAVDHPRGVLRVSGPDGVRETRPFDHVVNCAWEGRLALDRRRGTSRHDRWCFRMKYFARTAPIPGRAALPSTTIVLGPFGDVVDYGDGAETYLSWYPVGRRGWSEAVEPPDWPTVLDGDEAAMVVRGISDGLSGVVSEAGRVLVERPERAAVHGGVIYALGSTDVSDPLSKLHYRDRVGPRSYGSYHTVDTGKSTLAPLFAMQLADRITGVPVVRAA